MLGSTTVADLLRTDVVTVPPDASAVDLARTMRDEAVGCVVVTEDDRPVGLITDRGLTVRLVADDHPAASTTARDVMSERVVTVGLDTCLFELTETMEDHVVRPPRRRGGSPPY
ncbi:CBS domain-containing protein [Halomarina salina]|uniref:CBS domain-containing protein n=1 Tax=Halomarina salina TaxID=1872699 RepID=A0ABD5RKU0_9EURY|nr:CBS domain-containing protein [Halomarina salina]